MICTSATGCASTSFCSSTSAGGQLEHPSEVKSSTITVSTQAASVPIRTILCRRIAWIALLFSALDDPPDHQTECHDRGNRRQSEQPQRSIKNRLRLHPRFDLDRRAFQAIGER